MENLEKGKTVKEEYYAGLLQRLNQKIENRRPHSAKKKILFHHDNAPAQTFVVVIAKLHELRFELLLHPTYFADLAPWNFYGIETGGQ